MTYDEEGNPQVDRAARSEHRNSNSHSPRSNILSGRLDKEGSQMAAFFWLFITFQIQRTNEFSVLIKDRKDCMSSALNIAIFIYSRIISV